MNKARILLFLGIWVAVLPYLGFPSFWKNILATLSGLGFVYIGYVIYQESRKSGEKAGKTFDNFSENKFGNYDSEQKENLKS
ncbi:MAG: hypothetical protein V4699_01640 [Patescibacteria group bacterium]